MGRKTNTKQTNLIHFQWFGALKDYNKMFTKDSLFFQASCLIQIVLEIRYVFIKEIKE